MKTLTICDTPGAAGYISYKGSLRKQIAMQRAARAQRWRKIRQDACDLEKGTCTVVLCLVLLTFLTALIRVWEVTMR
jgi:hypothetical protein